MSLAVLEKLSLGFGKKSIVDELDLRIAPDDRIGVIGPNGSGKTSLMRLLTGEQAPDGGTLTLRSDLRLGYLPQDLVLQSNANLLQFVVASVGGREELQASVAKAEAHMRQAERDHANGKVDDDALMAIAEKLSELHERVTHFDVHFTEHEAIRILDGLGFTQADLTRPLSELSGGWKMRAVLASLLFQEPDLLLLDEPTNHLDLPSATWLAEFLKAYRKAFLLICHDREFLNEQIARVVSFEPEGVRQYTGDYEQYLRQRAEEEVILENKAKNLARERQQAERFINRFRAQASKARSVQSRVKQLEKMDEVETFQRRRVMRFRFPPCDRCGVEVVTLNDVGKAYGEHRVLSGIDLTVRRGDRIGIIGVNGAGKTTLLRTMAGEVPLTEGEIDFGHNVKVSYYAQHHAETLHPNDTIYDCVYREDPDSSITRVRTILGAFLFSNDDVDKKIGVLSGGERARVALAKLLIRPGNLLMMDEPTNHLDLASSEALAQSLDGYDGTLIFVSHNRSFVRQLATRIWHVEGGTVDNYPGTLDEYLESCRQRQRVEVAAAAEPTAQPELKARQRGTRAEEKERKRREAEARNAQSAQRKLANSVAEIEARITELEAEQTERSQALADPDVYADAEKSNALLAAYREAKDELDQLHQRWEQHATELDRLASQ